MRMTHHATIRMAQRGISQRALEYTLAYGSIVRVANATHFVLRKRDLPAHELRTDAEVRRFEGTIVIVENDHIVTVYRNRNLRRLNRKFKRDRARSRRSQRRSS